jgi:hypothetical protein
LAEWLYEAGIGENRAALVDGGQILEAAIELPGTLRVATVAAGRLAAILIPGRRGIVQLADGEVLVEPLPPALTQGAAVRVRIVREAGLEQGRSKRPKGVITDEEQNEGPSLRERLAAGSTAVRDLSGFGPDLLEVAGWSELLEQALLGDIIFPDGALRMSLTPAMTLFDVDGTLAPADLAVAGAAAAGRAIRRLAIGGSIGIDLPTVPGRAERQAAAAALDATLPQPFERTAVNGFGFLQLVRRRERASLPERLQRNPAEAAARALLRQAERSSGSGPRTLHAAPAVIGAIEAKSEWTRELERHLGCPVRLHADPGLAISAYHVHAAVP